MKYASLNVKRSGFGSDTVLASATNNGEVKNVKRLTPRGVWSSEFHTDNLFQAAWDAANAHDWASVTPNKLSDFN